jgi:hypothetical protein
MMIALASDSAAALGEAESALVAFLDRLLGESGSGSRGSEPA